MHGPKIKGRKTISLSITALQRALAHDAIRVFKRRTDHAYRLGVIPRVYLPPVVKGTVLEMPCDPDSVRMFLICIRICNLQDPQSGRTQAAEGLTTRLNREALAAGLIQEAI